MRADMSAEQERRFLATIHQPSSVISVGEVLIEEFLRPLGLSTKEFADKSGLPEHVITGLLSGRASITPATAKGLARGTGTSSEFWVNLEARHDRESQLAIGRVLARFAGCVADPSIMVAIRYAIAGETGIAPGAILVTVNKQPGESRLEVEARKGNRISRSGSVAVTVRQRDVDAP